MVTRYRWDFDAHASYQHTSLIFDRRKIPLRAPKAKTVINPKTGKPIALGAPPILVFSLRTRAYLSRRAFRYFRQLAFRDPTRYRRALRTALSSTRTSTSRSRRSCSTPGR